MSRLEAASRIVSIQEALAAVVLGTPKRGELMAEQTELWDRHFLGRPYEDIAKDAWMHKIVLRYS